MMPTTTSTTTTKKSVGPKRNPPQQPIFSGIVGFGKESSILSFYRKEDE